MSEVTIASLIESEHAFMGSDWVEDSSAPADSPIKGHRHNGYRPCMICNDFFLWGGSDAEPLNEDHMPAVRQAIADCGGSIDNGTLLWVARARQMRPQGAYYSYFPRETWPLFDACGPERETGFGNPYRPGEYKTRQEDSANG